MAEMLDPNPGADLGPGADLTLPEGADPLIFGPPLTWWRDFVKRAGRLPARTDFIPEDLPPPPLRYIMLIDIGLNADRLRFRLVGTAHCDFNRRDFTGLYFEDIYPSGSLALDYVKGLYREMIEARTPIWSVNDFPHSATGHAMTMQRLMLPFSSGGEHVDLCLAVQIPGDREQGATEEPNPWHSTPSVKERARMRL